jgi:hypothetical protein
VRRAQRIIIDLGQFQLLEDVISQVQRLRRRLQPARVGGQSGYIEQPSHRSWRQDQPIPRQRPYPALRIGERQRVPIEVNTVHPAAHRVYALERSSQRDTDKPRVDQPAGHIGQQRRVQHVIDRRNNGHVHVRGFHLA